MGNRVYEAALQHVAKRHGPASILHLQASISVMTIVSSESSWCT